MKTIPCLILASALLIAAGLAAQEILYDNGPDPGNIYGWVVSNGYKVADSFQVAAPSTLTNVDISLYDVNVYNVPLSLDWRILDQPHGQVIASGSAHGMRILDGPKVNYFLFNQWLMQFDIVPAVRLPAGAYWLEISNATCRWGTGVWWGENNGPSKAFFNGGIGGIWKHGGRDEGGSESFQILGFPE